MAIHGPLQIRGETRCPGGVSVSCLASRTRHECLRNNESEGTKNTECHWYNKCIYLTRYLQTNTLYKAKEKYRGIFEIQKSGDKTSSGEIGLDIRTHASPKVGQDQVSGGVSVLCWHAAPVAYVLWKPCTIR